VGCGGPPRVAGSPPGQSGYLPAGMRDRLWRLIRCVPFVPILAADELVYIGATLLQMLGNSDVLPAGVRQVRAACNEDLCRYSGHSRHRVSPPSRTEPLRRARHPSARAANAMEQPAEKGFPLAPPTRCP
jgi:hypothetical protein